MQSTRCQEGDKKGKGQADKKKTSEATNITGDQLVPFAKTAKTGSEPDRLTDDDLQYIDKNCLIVENAQNVKFAESGKSEQEVRIARRFYFLCGRTKNRETRNEYQEEFHNIIHQMKWGQRVRAVTMRTGAVALFPDGPVRHFCSQFHKEKCERKFCLFVH